MREWYAGPVEGFTEETRRLINVDGDEVVVFRVGGSFRAFVNSCPHMGGPVGEGLIMGRVHAVLDDQRRLIREEFSETDLQLVCPWHGWAYDVDTGVCAGKPTLRLKSYRTEVRDDGVYVLP